MIKKVEITTDTEPQTKLEKAILLVFNGVATKLNEIIDAVNDITDWAKRTDETIVKYGIKPIPEKIAQGFNNLQDPYAAQKKWIGKLCRFWDMETDKGTYGILTDIKDDRYVCPNGMFMCNRIRYHHCEPVKPDDDIIYKGE